MKRENYIGRAIVASMLLLAFMLPFAVQFSHIFEGHEHVVCSVQDTHFHKNTPDCPVCHFHFASFNYDVADYSNLLLLISPAQVEKLFSSRAYYSFNRTNAQLRAPPALS